MDLEKVKFKIIFIINCGGLREEKSERLKPFEIHEWKSTKFLYKCFNEFLKSLEWEKCKFSLSKTGGIQYRFPQYRIKRIPRDKIQNLNCKIADLIVRDWGTKFNSFKY